MPEDARALQADEKAMLPALNRCSTQRRANCALSYPSAVRAKCICHQFDDAQGGAAARIQVRVVHGHAPAAATAFAKSLMHDLRELRPREPSRQLRLSGSAAGTELGSGEHIEVGVQPPVRGVAFDSFDGLLSGATRAGTDLLGRAEPDPIAHGCHTELGTVRLISLSEH